MNFNAFWKWLQFRSRKIDTLDGNSLFKIKVPKNAHAGLIESNKSAFSFSKGDALRVWDRYHGFLQAEKYLVKNHPGILIPNSLHQMASCYAKPVGLVQNWQDYPEPFQCAPWIAAAIRDFSAGQK